MPRFKVRLTVDETFDDIDAEEESDALDEAWIEVFRSGAWGSEVNELEDDDSNG